jgi:hypothetical protein
VGEEREVEENGGEEREGKETDRCPLTGYRGWRNERQVSLVDLWGSSDKTLGL